MPLWLYLWCNFEPLFSSKNSCFVLTKPTSSVLYRNTLRAALLLGKTLKGGCMQSPNISLQQILLYLILLCALGHFLLPLTKYTCGDLFSLCKVKGIERSNLRFCRSQSRYWKWKLYFFALTGEHANICMTMIELGEKNYSIFKSLIAAQASCTRCKDANVGMAELDRATRAFRSAQNISRQCSFRFYINGPR
jgi:hypothetical protein